MNVVPTSAISGEGIPDLLQLMVKLTQTMLSERLMLVPYPQATVGGYGRWGLGVGMAWYGMVWYGSYLM